MAKNCLHCANPAGESDFCCSGCETVHALLSEQGLDRYYALRAGAIPPAAPATRPRSFDWLIEEVAAQERSATPRRVLHLDVQGIHCAACVWLIEELARRQGDLAATVNPTMGTMIVRWRGPDVAIDTFAEELARLGYLVGRAQKHAPRALRALGLRLGFAAALTMNVMLIAFAFYAGLGEGGGGGIGASEASVARIFSGVLIALASAVVAIGGSYFGARAWAALRRGLWHLDIPIALGILLAYATALTEPAGRGYLDTLCVFVTLMLLGRYLQERVLERNRGRLLAEEHDLLRVRRVRPDDHGLEWVVADQIAPGDALLLAPGELFPVDALASQPGLVSTDWIDGEPAPRPVAAGEAIVAGSFCAGKETLRAVAINHYATGSLARLLRQDTTRAPQRGFWDRFARIYVALVLGLAAAGGIAWLFYDPLRAPEITVALLVVTCPCAIGIVTPLAREVIAGQLRRRGLYLRNDDFLDRLTGVRTVVFDKTGTLTLGDLELHQPGSLGALAAADRDALYTMVAQSNHPVSRTLARALGPFHPTLTTARVREEPGCGLICELDGVTYRLGKPSWAAPEAVDAADARAADATTVLSRDGILVEGFRIDEHIRPAARHEIQRLWRSGIAVWLLSGDRQARVQRIAERLGIDPAHARGDLSAEEKRAIVEHLDHHDTLYVGDGGNDCRALGSAMASLAVNVEQPVLAARADAFLLGENAAPIVDLLDLAQKLRRQVRRNFAFAALYNAATVTACLLGVMTPLRAAIAMPAGSLAVLFFTLYRLRTRRRSEQLLQSVAPGDLAWKS